MADGVNDPAGTAATGSTAAAKAKPAGGAKTGATAASASEAAAAAGAQTSDAASGATATAVTGAPATAPAAPAIQISAAREFIRVAKTRPDWLWGMISSWAFGLGFYAYLYYFTHPDLVHHPLQTIVPVVLTALADGSLTNQLAAEPQWAAQALRDGCEPARILKARNIFLVICELLFVAFVVGLTVYLSHTAGWVPAAIPQVAVLPLLPIAIGNIASVLLPCPFMRLRHRFQTESTWIRWALYVTVPFVLSSITLGMYALPALVQQHFEPHVALTAGRLANHPANTLSDSKVFLVTWLVITPLWHLTIWYLSLKFSEGVAHLRRHGLIKLMDHHDSLIETLDDLTLIAAAKALPQHVKAIPTDIKAEIKLIGEELLEASTTLARL